MKKIVMMLLAVLILTGCGRSVSEGEGIFETLSLERETEPLSETASDSTEESTEDSQETKADSEETGGAQTDETEETEETASVEASVTKESEPEKTEEPTKTPKPAKAEEPAKTSEPVKSPKPEKTKEPVNTPKPVKAEEPAKIPEPAKPPVAENTPAPVSTPESVHTHTLVEEITPATCTEAQVVTTKCSSCGEVTGTRTEGSALGHDFEWKVYSAPTCKMKGYGYNECKRCGIQQDDGYIEKLPHDYDVILIAEGDCKSPRVTEKVCKVCGTHEPREEDWNAHKDDHVWTTETGQVWSDEAFAMVDVSRTYCAVCNKEKPD